MPGVCVRHVDLPGTSRLFADFLHYYDRVSAFYEWRPFDFGSLEAAAAKLRYPPERRAALVAALERQNGPGPLLEVLARPETVAVVTGQQVGLYGGPAYTIYKALTAVKLARDLSARGLPAVPVFWLATEDHDFAEVDHVWCLDAANQPVRLQVAGPAPSLSPAGEVPLRGAPSLRGPLGELPYADEVCGAVESAYVDGRTFGSAFQQLLTTLLGTHGLLFLDPLAGPIRVISASFMQQALDSAPALSARLLERNRELEAAGYHAQVLFDSQSSLFFVLDGGRRVSLKTVRPKSAEQLSPNALLRPVVQDYLLPTVAHVGGPAEVAYLAQSQVLYEMLSVPMPVEAPRAGFTLLDAHAVKLMGRYGMELRDLLDNDVAVREEMARKLVPEALLGRIRETAGGVSSLLDGLGAEMARFDPSLRKAFDRSRSKMLYQLAKTERKAAREAMRRDERAQNDAAYLTALVYPHKHLQERFYGILPFLARHGLDLTDRIYESIHLGCPDHQLLAV
jgi:uncharacterized protein YllA (UPF0747 family)